MSNRLINQLASGSLKQKNEFVTTHYELFELQSSCKEPITTGTLEATNLLSTVFVNFVKSYS